MSEVLIGGTGASASEEVAKLAEKHPGSARSVPSASVVIESQTPLAKPGGSIVDEPKDAANKDKEPQGSQEPSTPDDVKDSKDAKDGANNDNDDPDGFYVGDFDMTALAEEFEKDGKLSEESYKELEENGFSRELVDTYIRGVQAAAGEAGELAKEHVDAIIAEVGGLERFEAVMKWADGKLSQEEKDAYNKAATGEDPVVARLVVQGLVSRYEREYGHAPTLLKGGKTSTSSSPSTEGFPDRTSMIRAMKDPRYGNDPEYTRSVESRVLRSGLMRSGRSRNRGY